MHNVQKDDLFVLGFCGKAGAGKTTIANMVLNQFLKMTDTKIGCVIIPFAKALKDLAVQLGWDGVKDERGRRLLQLLGTDVCRDCISEDYWVERWKESVARERARKIQLIVADDVRFENELNCIKSLGGITYQLVGRSMELSKDASTHPSEQLYLKLADDLLISNTSTFEALECRAKEIVKRLIKWTY